jgi:hypothetical protein
MTVGHVGAPAKTIIASSEKTATVLSDIWFASVDSPPFGKGNYGATL